MPVVSPQQQQQQQQQQQSESVPPTIVNLDFIRTGGQFGSPKVVAAAAMPEDVRPRSSSRRLEDFYQATQQAVEKAVEKGVVPARSLPISMSSKSHREVDVEVEAEAEQQQQQQMKQSTDKEPVITLVNLDFLRTGSQFGGLSKSQPSLSSSPPSSSQQRLEDFYRKTQEAVEKSVAAGKAPKQLLQSPASARKIAAPLSSSAPSSSTAAAAAAAAAAAESLPSDLVLNVSFLKSGTQFKAPSPEPQIQAEKHLTAAQRLESFHAKMQQAVEQAAKMGFSPKTQRAVR